MLATQGSAVFLHQHRHIGGDVAKHLQPRGRAQIEERPQVELSSAGVGIVDAVDPIFFGEQTVEFRDVGWQILDSHGSVFDDLARLSVPGHVIDEALAGSAELPDTVPFGTEECRIGVAYFLRPQFCLQRRERCFNHVAVGVADLNNEHGAWIPHDKGTVPRLLEVVFRAVENLLVDQLAAGGPHAVRGRAPHRDERAAERLVDRGAVHTEQAARRRQRDQVELILDAKEKRALRTRQQPAHIERTVAVGIEAGGVHESVKGVAGVAAGDLGPGKRVADQPTVGGIAKHITESPVNPCFQRVGPSALRGKLRGRERAERRL